MLKKILVVGFAAALAVAGLISCGGGSSTIAKQVNGSIFVMVQDAPQFCDILSYRQSISAMSVITPDNKTVTILPEASTFIAIDWTLFQDVSTLLTSGAIKAGTYASTTFNLGTPTVNVYDPTRDPPSRTINTSETVVKPVIPMVTNLVINQNKVSLLNVDFNIRGSTVFGVDTDGNPIATVTPVISVATVNNQANNLAAFDDMAGFVRSITTPGSSPGFTGSILLQTLGGGSSFPTANINLSNSTVLTGVTSLSTWGTDTYVEVAGYIDANGNIIATRVEVQDKENIDTAKHIGVVGYPTAVLRDANGDLQTIQVFLRDIEPNSTSVSIDTFANVDFTNLAVEPTYNISAMSPNFTNPPMTFDASNIIPGQELVVHGDYTVHTGAAGTTEDPTVTLAPGKIFLKAQGFQGNYVNLLESRGDNKTGAFTFDSCCSLLSTVPIYVFTTGPVTLPDGTEAQTNFVNVSGLGDLSPLHPLLIRGLPFYEPNSITVNGITVPAKSIVFLANQVHELD
jgi:hypothetical protein